MITKFFIHIIILPIYICMCHHMSDIHWCGNQIINIIYYLIHIISIYYVCVPYLCACQVSRVQCL